MRDQGRTKSCFAFLVFFSCWATLALSTALPRFGLPLNVDPDWAYLMNAADFLNGNSPGSIDHPGTVLHWVNAAILFVLHKTIGSPAYSATEDILMRPELYLHWAGFLWALLFASAFSWSALALRRHSGNLAAIIYTLVLLVNPEIVLNLRRLNPTAATAAIAALLLAWALPRLAKEKLGRGEQVALAGFLSLGIWTKAPFLPLLGLHWAWKKRSYVVPLCAFLLFSVLISIPVWPQLGKMYDFYFLILTHKGIYGSGEPGFMDFSRALEAFQAIWARDNASLLLLLALPFLRTKRLAWAALTITLLAFLMALKNGGGMMSPPSRHLSPVVVMLAFLCALGISERKKKIAYLLPLLIVASGLIRLVPAWQGQLAAASGMAQSNEAYLAAVKANPECAQLVSYPVSNRIAAFATSISFTGPGIARDLAARVYPAVRIFTGSVTGQVISFHLQPPEPWNAYKQWFAAFPCVVGGGLGIFNEAAKLFPGSQISGNWDAFVVKLKK